MNASTEQRLVELFRLETISKPIKSSHQPNRNNSSDFSGQQLPDFSPYFTPCSVHLSRQHQEKSLLFQGVFSTAGTCTPLCSPMLSSKQVTIIKTAIRDVSMDIHSSISLVFCEIPSLCVFQGSFYNAAYSTQLWSVAYKYKCLTTWIPPLKSNHNTAGKWQSIL